jgi:ribosomal RNA-processing protein 1
LPPAVRPQTSSLRKQQRQADHTHNATDRKLRTDSLDSLRLFLSTRATLSPTDALKLWKGLYYAHYMTDRPLPQQRLASDLASLVDVLPRPRVIPVWFAAFWEVLSERWPHVDALRMDKFLLLVRRVFAAQLRHAAKNTGVADVLAEWPFELEGDLRKVPLGLRLHALDMWIDELEREGLLGGEDREEDADTSRLVRQVGDMVQALRYSPIKAVRERARESDDDDRLPWVQKKEETKDDDEWGGFDD